MSEWVRRVEKEDRIAERGEKRGEEERARARFTDGRDRHRGPKMCLRRQVSGGRRRRLSLREPITVFDRAVVRGSCARVYVTHSCKHTYAHTRGT